MTLRVAFSLQCTDARKGITALFAGTYCLHSSMSMTLVFLFAGLTWAPQTSLLWTC